MNCPNCKQPLADGRKFCTNCGHPTDYFDANALGIGFTDVLTKKYFCFRGRARRKEYWMFVLFTCIIGFVLRILIPFVFPPTFGSFFVLFVYLCGFGIPEFGVTVRRFQDTGKNGWFAAMLLGAIWGLGVLQLAVILQFIFIIPMFILASFDSQPGPNKYGPNPKGQ